MPAGGPGEEEHLPSSRGEPMRQGTRQRGGGGGGGVLFSKNVLIIFLFKIEILLSGNYADDQHKSS